MLSNDSPIYCIGDSHACIFSGVEAVHPAWPHQPPELLSWCRSRHIGPKLAYNLTLQHMESVLTNLPKNSRILLCFGEIDCFLHLHPQAIQQERALEDVIDACVVNYVHTACDLRQQGYHVMMHNVIPSEPRESWSVNNKKPFCEAFPVTAREVRENEVNRLFNRQLLYHCTESRIPFVATFDTFVGADGVANLSYYAEDKHHLNLKAMPIIMDAIAASLGV